MLELLQYECDVKRERDGSVTRDSVVVCWPVERLFRRYVMWKMMDEMRVAERSRLIIIDVKIERGRLWWRRRLGRARRERRERLRGEVR